jgi:hypothetical protein
VATDWHDALLVLLTMVLVMMIAFLFDQCADEADQRLWQKITILHHLVIEDLLVSCHVSFFIVMCRSTIALSINVDCCTVHCIIDDWLGAISVTIRHQILPPPSSKFFACFIHEY